MKLFKKKFCKKCGKRLVWRTQRSILVDNFNTYTGKPNKPRTFEVGQCPKYESIYEFNNVYPNGHSQEFA